MNEWDQWYEYTLYTIKQVWFTSFLEYRFSYISKMFVFGEADRESREREVAHHAYWQQKVTPSRLPGKE